MWTIYAAARRLSRRYYAGDKFPHTTYNFPPGVGHFLSFARKFCPILWGICLFWYGIQSQSPPISQGGGGSVFTLTGVRLTPPNWHEIFNTGTPVFNLLNKQINELQVKSFMWIHNAVYNMNMGVFKLIVQSYKPDYNNWTLCNVNIIQPMAARFINKNICLSIYLSIYLRNTNPRLCVTAYLVCHFKTANIWAFLKIELACKYMTAPIHVNQ
jgi:hypothetical protein